MRTRLLPFAAAVALSGCGGGVATLGYAVPGPSAVRYSYGDTTRVRVSMMGQNLDIGMLGSATYDVGFGRAPGGVEVTLTVADLDATVEVPMAGAERADEGGVSGRLVFTLDERGTATVTETPEVTATASRMISRLGTAHTFFPGLPARAVAAGDSWVDTVSYEGTAETGEMSETAVVTYSVVGDTVVAGRTLLHLAMVGTTEMTASANMGGMSVRQSSSLKTSGHVLWDEADGVMHELVRTAQGSGTASVPISPTPLPITVTVTQRATRMPG